jgi:hypothetical protein
VQINVRKVYGDMGLLIITLLFCNIAVGKYLSSFLYPCISG